MTVGQRIAQKRKELGLSQEALGDRLGVSRQAIYKWESDSSLPEIEKLIALSRIFSVPVGWLLGVEDLPPVEAEQEGSPAGELTEEQLAMVREIVDHYLAALPAPKRRNRRWMGVAAALCLAAIFFNLFHRLDRVTQDYNQLQSSIVSLSRDLDVQTQSIANRVEDILQKQNELTAEWSVQLLSTDPAANTATFTLQVVPRTYVAGMTALFVAKSGEETVELPADPGADHAFSGLITCPLTDEISLSVVLIHGDQRQTQHLEDFDDLYSSSFPGIHLKDTLFLRDAKNGLLPAGEAVELEIFDQGDGSQLYSPLQPIPDQIDLRVGLFRDRELVVWYDREVHDVFANGKRAQGTHWVRQEEVPLEEGHTYCEAVVYTDPSDRQLVYFSIPRYYSDNMFTTNGALWGSSDPDDWNF